MGSLASDLADSAANTAQVHANGARAIFLDNQRVTLHIAGDQKTRWRNNFSDSQ